MYLTEGDLQHTVLRWQEDFDPGPRVHEVHGPSHCHAAARRGAVALQHERNERLGFLGCVVIEVK